MKQSVIGSNDIINIRDEIIKILLDNFEKPIFFKVEVERDTDAILDLITTYGYENINAPATREVEMECGCQGTEEKPCVACEHREINLAGCSIENCKCDCQGTGKRTIKQYAFVKCEAKSCGRWLKGYRYLDYKGGDSTTPEAYKQSCPTCSGSGYKPISKREFLPSGGVEWKMERYVHSQAIVKPYLNGQPIEWVVI